MPGDLDLYEGLYHDSKKIEKLGKQIAELCELFVPFVKPIVTQRVKEEVSNPMTAEERSLMASAVSRLIELDDREKAGLEAFVKNPESLITREQEAEFERKEVDESTRTITGHIVTSWITGLWMISKEFKRLSGGSLDDYMWPIGEFDSLKRSLVASFVINCEDLQSIFRAVKKSLPAGKVLPDAALEYLKLEGIEVVE